MPSLAACRRPSCPVVDCERQCLNPNPTEEENQEKDEVEETGDGLIRGGWISSLGSFSISSRLNIGPRQRRSLVNEGPAASQGETYVFTFI